MARDPPSLLASSELRDLPLQPSAVHNARITIIHPQLRDLILPLERGRVLYPRGSVIEEIRWDVDDGPGGGAEGENDEMQGSKLRGSGAGSSDAHAGVGEATSKPFVRLNFIPNCLTGSRGILAAGGQHGELYLSSLPQPSLGPSIRLGGQVIAEAASHTFSMSSTLPTRAINNSIAILPSYPDGWDRAAARRHRRMGYIGEGAAEDESDANRDDDRLGEEGVHFQKSRLAEDDDEAIDLDDDDDILGPPLSPATYPNTVPFRHPPRIPYAGGSSSSGTASRRASSFSHVRTLPPPSHQTRLVRQSFSVHNHPSQPPARVVSSTPNTSRSASMSMVRPVTPIRSRAPEPPAYPWEPRILVSSNDQSVKMFSLRSDPTSSTQSQAAYHGETQTSFMSRRSSSSLANERPPMPILAASPSGTSLDWRDHRMRTPPVVLPPPPPMMGSRFGWDSVGINQGLLEAHRAEQHAAAAAAAQRNAWERDRQQFESAVGMSVSINPVDLHRSGAISHRNYIRPGMQAPTSGVRATVSDRRDDKRLAKVGGTTFKSPVNHSSFSPDLKTMISVGDSTDVSIFEVIDGGRDFRKIGLYHAATDSGFSSAWSSDGRKFAVASQDGQVTVWDHRSSRPLSTLFTSFTSSGSSSNSSSPRSPSFSADISAARRYPGSTEGWTRVESRTVLVDPLTGEPSSGASTSGREAARVVKFSPEGSSRELLVFSEENTNIHVVDAKTFNTHVVLPVPLAPDVPGSTPPALPHRTGVEGGECGIAGIAFDPTGDWLYSGTERSVVEWDLRGWAGSGEAGSWRMA